MDYQRNLRTAINNMMVDPESMMDDPGSPCRINAALGTDGYPHDMIEEMRIAGLVSKVASGHVDLLRTEHVFETATLGAARSLGREDLGRLHSGAKADIVLIDLAHPSMRPVRDPLRSLIYSGVAAAVRDVYVFVEHRHRG